MPGVYPRRDRKISEFTLNIYQNEYSNTLYLTLLDLRGKIHLVNFPILVELSKNLLQEFLNQKGLSAKILPSCRKM